MRPLSSLAATLFVLTACAGGDKPAADPQSNSPAPAGVERARQAAAVVNAMSANPSRADSILAAAGYTVDSFERLMYEIAADSAQSAAYAAAKSD